MSEQKDNRENIADRAMRALQELHDLTPQQSRAILESLIEPLIEEAKQITFDKGVRHGTTIRNLDWNSENHQRHGEKMRKAVEQERERIFAWGNELCSCVLAKESPYSLMKSTLLKRECNLCWQAIKNNYQIGY